LGISLSPPAHPAGDSVGATGSHVPCKSPGQARAAYMPDAIWAVSRLPPDSSRSPGLAPVSTPLLFVTTLHQRFALTRLPDPHLTRSTSRLFRSAHHERLLADAACGGLKPPPARRLRRTHLHLLHSTASGGPTPTPPSAFLTHDLPELVDRLAFGGCPTRLRSPSGPPHAPEGTAAQTWLRPGNPEPELRRSPRPQKPQRARPAQPRRQPPEHVIFRLGTERAIYRRRHWRTGIVGS
jgi:hypothetical protein